MAGWLSDPTAAAWVQAGSSIATVFVAIATVVVAVWIPAHRRRQSIEDARDERNRQEKEYLKRVCAALRAEIEATQMAAERHETAIGLTLKRLEEARAHGATITGGGRLPQDSVVLTDAIIYRRIAAELGRLPPELNRSIVVFCTIALDLGRLANGATTAQSAYETILKLAPRLKMSAAVLISNLDKFEAANFAPEANIHGTVEEFRALAAKVGYPADQVLRERGLIP